MEETIMVNLLLASGAAIIGAATGVFGRDLIINKTVVVDATDLSDPKVVLQPKREKKKKEDNKEVKEKIEEKVDKAEQESPQEEDVAEAEVAIEKVEGEVVESNEKVEPFAEPETVSEPEKPVNQAEEKPKNKSKKAKAGEEKKEDTTASPEEPAIVTNTAETQPAQFTTIDKPVDKQEESQPTTEANNQ